MSAPLASAARHLSACTLVAAAALAQIQPADRMAMGKMWTFENPPLAYLEQEYGFKPDQKWLDTLRLSALRLGDASNSWCSASFVSPKGLILTNHHCVREQITAVQQDRDWLRNGFAARMLEEEIRLPGLTVQQLVATEDVTAAMNADIAASDDADVVAIKRQTNRERVQQQQDLAHPGYLNQIVPLYQGAIVQVYRYRIYADIRLVMAVGLQTARFGGDLDNFTFPRWSADFAFLRAYEREEPADTTANWLRWRTTGLAEGEPVFVPGNPGSTNRLMTTAQLACQRDLEYPIQLGELADSIRIVKPFAERNEALLATVLRWENSHKAIRGMLDGLEAKPRMDQKRAIETRFRAAVDANPSWQASFGDAWEQLERLMQRRRSLLPRQAFHAPSYSGVLQRAVALAKAFDPSRDDGQRSLSMQEAMTMRGDSNVLTRALTANHFERAAKWLPKNDEYLAVVAGAQKGRATIDWQAAVDALEQSALKDSKFVKRLIDNGRAAYEAETDPGVAAGRALWPLMRIVELDDKAIAGQIEVQAGRIGRALHTVYGKDVSPDATMTLRLSDGRALGYPNNGTRAPWTTSFFGLYARHTEFGGKPPFDLPKPWLDARDRLDLSRRLCFASTNDIVGGNSGSCIVDRNLEVVGVVFDSNVESLPNDFLYSDAAARCVSVHGDGILEALEKVYQVPHLVAELRGAAAK
jgi:hypothetical protein